MLRTKLLDHSCIVDLLNVVDRYNNTISLSRDKFIVL